MHDSKYLENARYDCIGQSRKKNYGQRAVKGNITSQIWQGHQSSLARARAQTSSHNSNSSPPLLVSGISPFQARLEHKPMPSDIKKLRYKSFLPNIFILISLGSQNCEETMALHWDDTVTFHVRTCHSFLYYFKFSVLFLSKYNSDLLGWRRFNILWDFEKAEWSGRSWIRAC